MSPQESSAKESQGTETGLPPIAPDFVEQNYPEKVLAQTYEQTPMIALGGSAGSIPALSKFFKTMPPDSGMVFIVILHLSPMFVSTLPDVLGRLTSMKVSHPTDGEIVEANHVYVIPPGKFLTTVNGRLQLTELENDRGKRVAVDLFFRSLADSYGPHATAVVLSGVDGDGAVGIKRIKERGGLTIAQDPDEAEHSGMPQSAIDTGMVDWVLKIGEMPGRLRGYRETGSRLRLPPEENPSLTIQPGLADDRETALRDVLLYLRLRTGRDFSNYKRATVVRRIARRMQVNGIQDLREYLLFLRTHPGEPNALLQDLLISVTNFFRDRDAFHALDQLIPLLFANKSASDSVRVWVPACATGEEAYSLAMLLVEYAHSCENCPALQVFACDLDEEAIKVARVGHYSDTIAADVSEERLKRFFVKDQRGYQVKREIREMILFATHDLLKDAPFSRMELISCRNLLIYLNRHAQQRVFETFQFALKPEGMLFLGSSESVDDSSPLFRAIDLKYRIYSHRTPARIVLPPASAPNSLMRSMKAPEQSPVAPVVHGRQFAIETSAASFVGRLGLNLDRYSLAELHFRLIERFASPSIVINSEYEIVHLSERAGRFLEVSGGRPTTNLLRLVHPELRIELRAALFRATESKTLQEVLRVPAEMNGQKCSVDIRVSAAEDIAPGLMLVVLEQHTEAKAVPVVEGMQEHLSSEPVVRHLERELEHVKRTLRDTVEQYESSTEELKASNEELQAMNEELRSATEELETSREELQSINEELTTVNQEMKNSMDDLAHANTDLQNLMAATSIATVFLDRDLAITRYTPAASKIFNLIPGDIGRPLAHLKHHLEFAELIDDAAQVLRTLVPLEREVTDGRHWFFTRLQPYRTLEDRIVGVVLTLFDVTERNRTTEALRESEERMRLLIESAREFAIFTTDAERHINSWNSGAELIFGYTEKEILGRSADILFTIEDREHGDPEREVGLARDTGCAANERWHARKDGSTFYGSGSVMPLRDKTGNLRGFVKIMRDLTETQRAQNALREHLDELTRFNTVAVGRETRMIELKKEINDLLTRLGELPRYALEFDQQGGPPAK